jgi:hypothetical protein
VTSIIQGTGATNDYYQIGDRWANEDGKHYGIRLGNLQLSPPNAYNLSTTPTVIPMVASQGAVIEYSISNSSAQRFGSMKLTNVNLTTSIFDDEYVETSSIPANLYANSTSIIATMGSGTASFVYHYRTFN